MDTIEQFQRALHRLARPVSDPPRAFPSAVGAVADPLEVLDRAVRLQWECAGQGTEIEQSRTASPPRAPPDRRSVAARAPRRMAGSLHGRARSFFDARGPAALHAREPDPHRGRAVSGEFARGSESATERATPAAVRVVFWALGDDRYYLLDVSSATGAISGVMPLR